MVDLKKFYDAATAATEARNAKAVEIQALMDKGETAKALEMKMDLDGLNKKAKEAEELYITMRESTKGTDLGKDFVPAKDREKAEEQKDSDILKCNEYTRAFFKAMATGASLKNFNTYGVPEDMQILTKALTESGGTPAGADGGFLLPVDFNNAIILRQKQFYDLADDVNVENVQAFSGWRAIEKSTQTEPFAKLTVDGATPIPQSNQPAFSRINYQVSDYGGTLPISNDLLNDTPVNLMAYLSNWFGKKAVLTHNSLILPILKALASSDVLLANQKTALDVIKSALNKTLDPNVSVNASIFANQTGYDILDSIKDEMGRPLMQPDPTAAGKYLIKGRPVKMLADRLMPNVTGSDTKERAMVYIADGKSLVTMFARSSLEMASTNIGGSAWANNNTEVRGITRLDVEETDSDAGCAVGLLLA